MSLHDDTDVGSVDYPGLGRSTLKPILTDSSNSYFNDESPIWTCTSPSSVGANSLFASAPNLTTEKSDLEDATEPSAGEHEQNLFRAFWRCKKLRFLLPDTKGNPYGEVISLQLEHEMVRPMLRDFVRFERTARQRCENRMNSSRNVSGCPQQLTATTSPIWDLLPPRSACDVLLHAYIGTFEGILSILYLPSFLQEYENLWKSSKSRGIELDQPFACKLLIAIALGSCICQGWPFSARLEKQLSGQAGEWIAYGTQWLARRMIAGSRANLDTAQIMCLLALTRHTHHHSNGTGWCSGGYDLTRVGIQMSLHREPRTRFPEMTARKRKFADGCGPPCWSCRFSSASMKGCRPH